MLKWISSGSLLFELICIPRGKGWLWQINRVFVNRATVWWQRDDHARCSPNLLRCIRGWALKRRQAVIFGQANGLFLTSAEQNSAICCGESLSAPRPSIWNREWTNSNLRAALSSWVQGCRTWTFCYSPWPPPSHPSTPTYYHLVIFSCIAQCPKSQICLTGLYNLYSTENT